MRDVTFDLLPKDQGSTLNELKLILKEHSFSYASIYQFQYYVNAGKSQKVFSIWPHPQKNEPDQCFNVSIDSEIFRVFK